MRMLRVFGGMLALLLLLASCSPGVTVTETRVWAYDTLCTGKVWGDRNYADIFESAAAAGQNLLSSDGKKQFTASAGGDSLPMSEDLYRILSMAQVLWEKTDGVFDLTVAPLSALWDVNSASAPPSAEAIAETLSNVGWDKVTLTEESLIFSAAGMGIDIGSVGKGYGADQTVAALKKEGAHAGVISFGGNVVTFGQKEGGLFRIGIRDPKQNEGGTLGVLTITDASVVTSGAYERFFEYEGEVYHHLLDATTGYPRQSDLLSVTVVSSDGAQADLMSTALWLMGAEKGWQLYQTLCRTEGFSPAEVIFVLQDGTVRISDGLKDSFALSAAGYRMEAP
ncbi:MAG: FAD:protein FMN transferase [Clostridia bacterium]|nr:FAD:protein FMN transferase [Clostridia bacterium]